MKNIMENLLALQSLELQTARRSTAQEERLQMLRGKIPAPVLGHYDRFVARRKKGVAIVRHGICGECHLQVAIGTLGALAFGTDLQLCGNCGRYLYLPEDETIYSPATPDPRAKRNKEARAYVN